MAINIIESQSSDTKRTLEFSNGDLEALKQVKEKYRFVNDELLIRFALVVLLKAEQNIVYVDENEQRVGLKPADSSVVGE